MKEVLTMALEKIADALPAYIDGVASREYLAIIHKALAQPPVAKPHEQEPVAWQKIECHICGEMAIATDIPPPQRKPLMPISHERMTTREFKCFMLGWRGAEVAHGIKE